jgi:hypothetical protein
LASGPMLRRVSSTISIPGVTLASRPPPTAASLLFFLPPVSDKSDASTLPSQWRRYGSKRDQILRGRSTWKYALPPTQEEPLPLCTLFFRALGFIKSPPGVSAIIIVQMAVAARFSLRPFFVAPGTSRATVDDHSRCGYPPSGLPRVD